MKIGNTEIKLYYNNQAAQEISELCGGSNNLSALVFDSEGNPVEPLKQLENVAKLVRILANNEIRKNNMLIKMGVLTGEPKEEYTDEQFSVILDASMVGNYFTECIDTIRKDSTFAVPDSVKMTEPDIDLEEIEAEKNP